MMEVLKKEMNKSLKETYKNKPWKEINKTVQGLKVKIESIKKTQMEEKLRMKNLGSWAEASGASFTNNIQEMEGRILDTEYQIERNGYPSQRKC